MSATPQFTLSYGNVNIIDAGYQVYVDGGNNFCDGGNFCDAGPNPGSFCDGGNFCDGGSPFVWVNLYSGDAGPSCLADGGPSTSTYDAGPLILNQCDAGSGQGCTAT